MYMVEITEDKIDKATEYAEKMLKYGGKLMQCLSEWQEEGGMDEREGMPYMNRNRYGEREEQGRYGNRGGSMGYRDDDDDWDMQERRRRDSRGRYK
jgi:hypothetical protein